MIIYKPRNGLRRNQTYRHVDLGLIDFRTVRKKSLLNKICYGNPTKLLKLYTWNYFINIYMSCSNYLAHSLNGKTANTLNSMAIN